MATKQVDPRVVMMKTAEYIEKTQPIVDAHEALMTGFAKRATQSAGALASLGFIDKRNINTFIDKVAADPIAMWDFVDKLAESAANADLGGADGVTIPDSVGGDAFERSYFPERFAVGNSGMVD